MKKFVLFICSVFVLFMNTAQAASTIEDIVDKHYYDNACAVDLKRWSVVDTADNVQLEGDELVLAFGTETHTIRPMYAAFSAAEYIEMYESEMERGGYRPLGVILKYAGEEWLGIMLPETINNDDRVYACVPKYLSPVVQR